MVRSSKAILPVLIVITGIVVAWVLTINSPRAQRKAVPSLPPMVQVEDVFVQDVRIPVFSQGTVRPRTSTNLSAEVTGRIIEASPRFANGAFFKKGDVLLRINPSDYELAITKAEALVASARQQLARAEAEYKQKLEEYKGIDPAKITDYALRKPQYEEAKANLKSATADLDLAKVQLQRCVIRAPFDGRVVEKKSDIGQYVTPGMLLAQVYATDVAEVRLPLSQSQINLLDLPSTADGLSDNNRRSKPVKAMLTGHAAGQVQTWESNIVRKEAVIDERNRLQYVVAQVKDPYGLNSGAGNKPELTTGLFVEAEIEGRLMEKVFVLPRQTIHNNNTVWILDNDNRLRIKTVDLLHRGEERVYISKGLNNGDTVILSPLDAVIDGMQLRTKSSPSNGT
ncbi:efflux RND transporter periplasmic adaptor subunit [Kaarinaea lacus]